jgi:radical SAM protein with 4Fe4S-binding SPASM domain
VSSTLQRVSSAIGRLLHGPGHLELTVGADGPRGSLVVPSEGDGRWHVRTVAGQPCLAPTEESYYLYVVVPETSRARAGRGAWLEVEYHGDRWAEFRVQYASRDRGADWGGLYKEAEQRWSNEAMGLRSFRRAVFLLPDFDPTRAQNHGASLRLEDRRGMLVRRVVLHLDPPTALDLAPFPAVAPRPDLRKMPGRFYPINYLFVEITNACNFKCTWCPDEIMGRRRGFMKKEKVFRILDEIAEKRSWLGPIYPVKLHQMGEPMLHPDLVEIVAHAESRGVPIELNTNCGLITEPLMNGLYESGLTNCILSYQTPDLGSFKTRKAPRIKFDEYRDKVRLAVERKVALGARTHLEIDIMNTKYSDNYKIVSEDEQAIAFLEDWIGFAKELEVKYGLAPRAHDLARVRSAHFLDQDENGSRYTILDGIDLVWKRCHSWGNVIVTNEEVAFTPASPGGPGELPIAKSAVPETYCPAPYDQFVIQWNGDVVSCCTDYEGRTKVANVFAQGIETIWKSSALRRRKQDMLEGRLLDVCAKCQGL